MRFLIRLCLFFSAALLYGSICSAAQAQAINGVTLYPIPAEVSSSHFIVTINGRRTAVQHAASGYYLLNFDVSGSAEIEVRSDDAHYWDRGVEIQPMRYGLRPVRHGGTIRFAIDGPAKLSITRPGDHFADAEMLFLFANQPDRSGIGPHTANVRYFGPGVHRENIDAVSGDTIYLAGGAVVFGALNLWQVSNVHVLGRGSIIYDGPQNPNDDEGWMHKRNWHCIVMDNAHNIDIEGISCIVRSRTWQIQMKDSRNIGFYNIKVIGGTANNANQDGMDWLGGGDTTVRNSFFRASDDVFALQGNWDGYDPTLLRQPGHDVTNITIEDTVTSTSISNIVRVAWPQKTFNSAHFHMRNIDVIHSGFGACVVPFAFFELWADPNGHGSHGDYIFEDIRLEDWYSLFQLRQQAPQVRDVHFSRFWAMDGPPMLAPVISGDVEGVTRDHIPESAFAVSFEDSTQGHAGFDYSSGALRPGQSVHFEADAPEASGRTFEWLFGDGFKASGRSADHRFPDAEGTLLDNTSATAAGRFRVLLHTVEVDGQSAWSSRNVVIGSTPMPPVLTNADRVNAPAAGAEVADRSHFVRRLRVPADGGYTIFLLTSTTATLKVDGVVASSPQPRPQVCGAPGDAVQPVSLSVVLQAGWHRLEVERDERIENADQPNPGMPRLLWEGPGFVRQAIPESALILPEP